jgi:hypothetical protein
MICIHEETDTILVLAEERRENEKRQTRNQARKGRHETVLSLAHLNSVYHTSGDPLLPPPGGLSCLHGQRLPFLSGHLDTKSLNTLNSSLDLEWNYSMETHAGAMPQWPSPDYPLNNGYYSQKDDKGKKQHSDWAALCRRLQTRFL